MEIKMINLSIAAEIAEKVTQQSTPGIAVTLNIAATIVAMGDGGWVLQYYFMTY
jgi:hypothetical protein